MNFIHIAVAGLVGMILGLVLPAFVSSLLHMALLMAVYVAITGFCIWLYHLIKQSDGPGPRVDKL